MRRIHKSNKLVLGSTFALTLLVAPLLHAQEEENEEIYELSPFTIDGSSDSGYYATETLSGTQLRTSVRDLANPVTILTEEMLEDIGALNYEEALEFLPSTQSFVGDVADIDGNSARTGIAYNSRGFRATRLTQNFFFSRIKQDGFSTERITQSRGPNSLLFGLGSVGGAINSTYKRGRFSDDTREVNFRADSEGSFRAELDINQILVEDKLAVRFAALYDDRRTHRDLQFRRRKSAYLNFTFKPTKKTSINFNVEDGTIDELNPRPYLTKDNFSGWLDSPLALDEKSNLAGMDVTSKANYASKNKDKKALTDLQNQTAGVSRSWGTNVKKGTLYRLVVIENDLSLPVMNWMGKTYSDEPWVNGTRGNSISFTGDSIAGIDYPVTNIVSGPSDSYDVNYNKWSVSLQQQLAENTYVELAYAHEESDSFDFRPVRRQDFGIWIDNNYYLPTQNPDGSGQPLNPYFGMPYIESNPWYIENDNDDDQYRVTLSHVVDMRDRKIFGNFDLGKLSLVGMYYARDEDSYGESFVEMSTTLDAVTATINRRYYLTGDNEPYYMGDPFAPLSQAEDASYAQGIVPAVENAFLRKGSPSYNPRETRSQAYIAQWSLFENRLIFTAGTRKDDITNRAAIFDTNDDGIYLGRDSVTLSEPTKRPIDNTNYGVVFKLGKNFDLFANESTNTVSAGGSNFDVFGRPLLDEQGEGEDIGFRAFLFDNKVILKLNRFENVRENSISNPLRNGLIRSNGLVEQFLVGMETNGYEDQVADALTYDEFFDLGRNGSWSEVESTTTEGYELEATINPTRNWRLMLNVYKNDSAITDTYVTFMPWYEKFVAPVAGDDAVRALFVNGADGDTLGDIIDGIDRKLDEAWAQVGGQRLRYNPWGANFVTSYRFRDGKMDGVRIGANARWREAPVIGYALDEVGDFDVANPFDGYEVFTADAFVSKRVKLKNDADLNLTFRVRNLFDDDGWYPNRGMDDGTGNVYYQQMIHQAPRTYELSVKYEF
ncbi:TonB-dependent siderophore receptor [Pelagicoccus mobilis]|uniref:TonB-dependent receptor plug domain-containing protein n=1 Tax=Pelagicoccus mobilis TaxID=415221 RepID=A0A934VMM9_9BACT|nr:hypothetical protein [Pelagicoccus mobilis]MBK1879021.1 hypothetical protein [Pelagicoccus mobilis]